MQQILGVFHTASCSHRAGRLFDALVKEHEALGEAVTTVSVDGSFLAASGTIDAYGAHDDTTLQRCVLLSGEASLGEARGAASLAALGRERPFAALAQADGDFVAASFDSLSRTGWLACDRHGFRHCYYHLLPGIVVFSSNAFRLARATATAELDQTSVVSMLEYGQLFGSHSAFEGVRSLLPGEVLTVSVDGLGRESFVPYAYSEQPRPIDAADLADSFGRAILQSQLTGRPASASLIPLSGGLDSRLIAASTAGLGLPARTFSFGDANSPDVVIAQAVASDLALPHTRFELTPGGLLQSLPAVVDLTCGEFNVIHSHGFTAYPAAARPGDVLLSGFAGDLTIGGSYLGDANGDPFGRLVGRMREGLDEGLLAQLLTPDGAERLRVILDELRAEYEGLPEEPGEARVDHFALLTRVRRFTANGLKLMNPFVPYRLPFFQRDFFDRTTEIPPNQRRDSFIYLEMLSRHFRSVARFPWQRTGVPPRGGVWLPIGREGVRVPRLRTPRRLAARYARSFVDYNAWFRGSMRQDLTEMLGACRLLDLGVIRPDRYMRLLDDLPQLTAQQASILLTVELLAQAASAETLRPLPFVAGDGNLEAEQAGEAAST